MEEKVKVDPLELLRRGDLPDFRKDLPRKVVELPRLSKLVGEPVLFELRALTYTEAAQLRGKDDMALRGLLLGCVKPNFRDPQLLDSSRGLAEPFDVIKSKLLPGEIDELWGHINLLSGYLQQTVFEIKNA